ncbi:MAG: trigger factor [Elusimicrobia bacterium]|nr:trigger factor [Elusimicrobiota bacterium]
MSIFSTKEQAGSKKIKEEGCLITLQIEVPAEKVKEATHTALIRLQSQARLPGFRPGKAPIEMVQQQLSGALRERVVDQLLRDAVPKACEEHKLHPLSSPQVHTLSMEEGKPLSFQVDVEVPPKVQAKDYKKLPVTRKAYAASDEELNKRLQELREGNARLEKSAKDAAAKDHYVVLDYQVLDNGQPLKNGKGQDELLDMSATDAAEGLVEGLVGVKRGETKDIPGKLKDKAVVFRVTLKEIKEKVLPKLDDEFSKDLGYASMGELQGKLKALLEEEAKHKSEKELIGQLEEGLLKNNRFAVPPSLVDSTLERMMDRLRRQVMGPKRDWPQGEREKVAEKLRPKAEDEVRLSYLLRAIADAEKITVTDQDHDAEKARSLEGAENDEQKANVARFFDEQRDQVAAMLLERKTVDFLKKSAAIKDA